MGKTRKNRQRQRGGSLVNFFKKKKTPLASQGNGNSTIKTNKSNNTVSYSRKVNLDKFVSIKQRKAEAAKQIREQMKRLKNVSNSVREEAFRLMPNNMRNMTRRVYNYKNANTLTNDQLVELYETGNVRSLSV